MPNQLVLEELLTKEHLERGIMLEAHVLRFFENYGFYEGAEIGAMGPHFASSYRHVAIIASFIEDLQKSREPVKFLDLGSGSGYIVAIAAYLGCEAFGIDFEPAHVGFSKDQLIKAKIKGLEMRFEPKIEYGNFYPKDFKVDFDLRGRKGRFFELNERCFDASRNEDAYSRLGISPSDIDVFYHFQLQEFGRVARFFSKYAKEGSFLLFAPSVQTDRMSEMTLPNNVRLVSKRHSLVYIYQKL